MASAASSISSGWPTRGSASPLSTSLADYAATKAGIDGYTKGVARHLGGRGITANVVQAGLMEGGMQPPDRGPQVPWTPTRVDRMVVTTP